MSRQRTGPIEVRPAKGVPDVGMVPLGSGSACNSCCEAQFLSGEGAVCVPLLYTFVACELVCPRKPFIHDLFKAGRAAWGDAVGTWVDVVFTGGCNQLFTENYRSWVLAFDTRAARVTSGALAGFCFIPCGPIPENTPGCPTTRFNVPSLAFAGVGGSTGGTVLGVTDSQIWTYDLWTDQFGPEIIARGMAAWLELAEFDILDADAGLIGLPTNFRRFAWFGAHCEDLGINLCAPEKTITLTKPGKLADAAGGPMDNFLVPGQPSTVEFKITPLDPDLVL